MRFDCTRKINLAKFYKLAWGKDFDKDLHGFETEDVTVRDCDSYDEASREADKLVAERSGYFTAKAEAEYKEFLSKKNVTVLAPDQNKSPDINPNLKLPSTGAPQVVPHVVDNADGVSSSPPAEFD